MPSGFLSLTSGLGTIKSELLLVMNTKQHSEHSGLYEFLVMPTPGNGLDVIHIQLDFGTYLLLGLDQVGYGYPFTFDQIGLDSTG